MQDRDINKVSETVVGTTENIKDGNDEIREVIPSFHYISLSLISMLSLIQLFGHHERK